jgi:hypothetical protein
MKTISNKLVVATLCLVTILATMTSSQAMAVVESNRLTTTTTEKTTSAVCTKITTLMSASNATVAAHQASMKTDFTKRISVIASNQADVDQKAATVRTSIADKFDAKITNIKKTSNLTAAQITAIDTYAANMKATELTREKAVDAARLTYRSALAYTVNTHQQNLIDATSAFENSVTNAFATAQASCTTEGSLATLKTSISTARKTLETARQSSAVGDGIKKLAATRDTAIKAADEAFGKSAADYTAILQALLG